MPSPQPTDSISHASNTLRDHLDAQPSPSSTTSSAVTHNLNAAAAIAGGGSGVDFHRDAIGDDSKLKNPRKRQFSSSQSSRTGQACDRCKHRKIRCDNTPGGCLPCQQNNAECKTTDRNTNRATVRGHAEALERDNSVLQHQLWELQTQLKDLGYEPRAVPTTLSYPSEKFTYSPVYRTDNVNTFQNLSDTRSHAQQNAAASTSTAIATNQAQPSEVNLFAQQNGRRPFPDKTPFADRDDGLLSTIRGTLLSVYDMKLDLAQFVTHQSVQPNGAHSYNTFLKMVQSGSKAGKQATVPELGSHQQVSETVQMFLRGCNPWHPILHPPTVAKLVDQWFKGYKAKPAEKVILHAIVAYIKYQMVIRQNSPDAIKQQYEAESIAHYHYTLTLVLDLFASRTLQDVQALCMICLLMRTFTNTPAPRTLLSWTMSLAIDLNLHRSARSIPEGVHEKGVLLLETRKRVFWTLMMIFGPVQAKSGLPMPLRSRDIDIEFPSMLNNDLQPAEGGTGANDCQYFHAIAFMKISRLDLEMWDTIYTCERPEQYAQRLRELENKASEWNDNDWPKNVKGPLSSLRDPQLRVYFFWMKRVSAEFQFLLHHPARCPVDAYELYAQNLDICADASYEFIQAVIELWRYKSLDSGWHTNVTFFAAIFIHLFCLEQRDLEYSPTQLATLRALLDSCLEVVLDIGTMFGSGSDLRAKTETIINKLVDKIKHAQMGRASSTATTSMFQPDAATYSPSIGSNFNRHSQHHQQQQHQQSPPQQHQQNSSQSQTRPQSQPHRQQQYQQQPVQQPSQPQTQRPVSSSSEAMRSSRSTAQGAVSSTMVLQDRASGTDFVQQSNDRYHNPTSNTSQHSTPVHLVSPLGAYSHVSSEDVSRYPPYTGYPNPDSQYQSMMSGPQQYQMYSSAGSPASYSAVQHTHGSSDPSALWQAWTQIGGRDGERVMMPLGGASGHDRPDNTQQSQQQMGYVLQTQQQGQMQGIMPGSEMHSPPNQWPGNNS